MSSTSGALTSIMGPSDWLPWLGTVVGSALGYLGGKRRNNATALKDEAAAADALSQTVGRLAAQLRDQSIQLLELTARLAAAEARASAAEARAVAADARAAAAETDITRLRLELAAQHEHR